MSPPRAQVEPATIASPPTNTTTDMPPPLVRALKAGRPIAKLMAGGISEALVTTMQGLVVAVPMLFLYTIVQTQSRRLIQVLEEQSAGFVARYQERLHASKAAA